MGILYEMSGTEGTLVRQRGAGVRTYAQAVEHQVVSSVANLTTLLVLTTPQALVMIPKLSLGIKCVF